MAYQKTAKDKAWDRERQKLQSERMEWIRKCGEKERIIQCQTGEIAILKQRIEDLEAVIVEFTKGEMTPDEAVMKLRKTAELADMMKFLANGTRGMF